MSAYLCSKKHIAIIVEALASHGLIKPDDNSRIQAARLLTRENLKSLSYRYGQKHGFHDLKSDRAYLGSLTIADASYPVIYSPHSEKARIGDRVKRIDSWIYQSCEHSSFTKSKAYKLVRQLQGMIAIDFVRETKEYEQGEW